MRIRDFIAMKVKYEDCLKQKLIAITTDTLVVGVDIAKNYQWARFVDFKGIEHDRALKFKSSRDGFETILARIRDICKEENFAEVVVGMEPTGHYWKAFANWLYKQEGIKVVLVIHMRQNRQKNWMTTARQSQIKRLHLRLKNW